jgi:hypothetical protein
MFEVMAWTQAVEKLKGCTFKVKSLSTYSLTTETIPKGGNYEQSK